jgi:hypothetical protein
MKTLRSAFVVFILLMFITGCAKSPDSISPTYVSPLQYSNCDCDQIKQEIARIGRKVDEVAGVQQRTANKDSVAMGVGLVLFWPALFFLASGDNKKEELARLKGEYECLESLAIQKKCDIAPELEAARKRREELAQKKKEEEQKREAERTTEMGHH